MHTCAYIYSLDIYIIYSFCIQEPNLRATQYLPDLVKLQNLLFEFFDRRLDKSEAERTRIEDFLRNKLQNSNLFQYSLSVLL